MNAPFLLLLFIFPFLSTFVYSAVPAPKEWKKVDEDQGLLIFERKEGDLLAFRTDGVVDAPMKKVASAILDSEHTTEWVEHLEEDIVLSRPAPNEYIEYTHVGTPFVLKDRDFLCKVTLSIDESKKELVIESHSVEAPGAPSTKYVRGHVEHNEFRLSPAEGGKTRLVGEFHIDPKGTVPKWVVNLFQRAWPKKAFRAIQKRVTSELVTLPKALESVLAPLGNF